MTHTSIANDLIKTIQKFEDQGMFGYDAEDAAIDELAGKGYDREALVEALNCFDEVAQDELTDLSE
jgi:hypothetical protein